MAPDREVGARVGSLSRKGFGFPLCSLQPLFFDGSEMGSVIEEIPAE